MQIAIRDDQPRFELPGAQRAGRPTGGHPFDELVRAMSARDNRDGASRPDNDLPAPERRSEHAHRDPDERQPAEEAERPARRAAAEAPAPTEPSQTLSPTDVPPAAADAKTAETAAPTENPGTEAADTPTAAPQQQTADPEAAATPQAAATPEAAAPQGVATDGSAAQPARLPGQQPANTETGEPSATAPVPQRTARGVDDGLLAQLNALLQARSPLPDAAAAAAKPTPAASPFTPGLPVALMAQALAGAQQTPLAAGATATAHPGQRILAAQAPGKAGKQAEGVQAGQGVAASQVPDFRAIAAAIGGGAAQGAGAASAAAATAAATGTEALGSSSNAPSGSPTATGTPVTADRAGQAARAEAPPPAHQPPRLSGPQFAERIGLTIARAAEAGVDRLSIRLNPAELGRIDVKMELGQDGRMTLSVAADRQETLDQLQRNVRDLERSLNEAGFDAGAGDLNFSLRQHNPSSDHDHGGGGSGRDGDEPGAEPGAEEAEDGIVITHRSGSHMVVDLFV